MSVAYPFSAIVGQDAMKEALLIAAIDGRIGGVMVFGDRGTGKSTAARALGALLPPLEVQAGCRFTCAPAHPPAVCALGCPVRAGRPQKKPVPFIDLPLGATEDRLVGSLDLERALATGEKRFEPGLLARAHRGFLYIDEVNLLEDHLVDLLLDVAASGENLVEREGLSLRHPARILLIGSGNPEEGELRPQLLDRFGLSVEVRTPRDPAERIEVVRRRDRFDRDPQAFAAEWARAERRLAARIRRARTIAAEVEVSDALIGLATALTDRVGADGLRGELTLMRAARARAALGQRREATVADLRAVAPIALSHRLRRNPLDETGSAARIARALDELVPA